MTRAQSCRPGQQPRANQLTGGCEYCPDGTWKENWGNFACVDAPVGSFPSNGEHPKASVVSYTGDSNNSMVYADILHVK